MINYKNFVNDLVPHLFYLLLYFQAKKRIFTIKEISLDDRIEDLRKDLKQFGFRLIFDIWIVNTDFGLRWYIILLNFWFEPLMYRIEEKESRFDVVLKYFKSLIKQLLNIGFLSSICFHFLNGFNELFLFFLHFQDFDSEFEVFINCFMMSLNLFFLLTYSNFGLLQFPSQLFLSCLLFMHLIHHFLILLR